ncbi:MAG: orotate phosphoribosyltransferase [Anaerolineae bacterium]|jgi:uridine monophosphate synthetase|nr:orotate phosphoribosyltransferase [Anaerolineae bacterium]MBT7074583.1 orotate phosphoribosyltransferase [Anaerolineae bacterium]MBT7783336.1 orotate phosphoribosyltransferase [Anaerolineae bacterium]
MISKRKITDLKLAKIADGLLEVGCVKFGEFELKSGAKSPIYIDLRRLVAFPELLKDVAGAYADILNGLDFDMLAALPYAAMPIGTAISLHGNWKMVYPRKEVKGYGTQVEVEGVFEVDQRAVVIDDLISTGGSKLEGIEKLNAVGLKVEDIVVLIDRQAGGVGFMEEHGYKLHSVFTLPQLLDYWEEAGAVDAKLMLKARAFLAS